MDKQDVSDRSLETFHSPLSNPLNLGSTKDPIVPDPPSNMDILSPTKDDNIEADELTSNTPHCKRKKQDHFTKSKSIKLDLDNEDPPRTPSPKGSVSNGVTGKSSIGERVRWSRMAGVKGRTIREDTYSPFKAPSDYSTKPGTVRAHEARQKRMLEPETCELERAGTADRAARNYGLEQLRKDPDFKAADANQRKEMKTETSNAVDEEQYNLGVTSQF